MIMNVAHSRWWQSFEVICGAPALVALVLQFFAPFSIPLGNLAAFAILIGVVLALTGLALVTLARRQFARFSQPTDPGHPTSRLIKTGVFAISRNPLYLGGLLIVAGIGLTFNFAWILLLLVPAVVGCHFVLVLPEERYLAAKFGGEYQAYAASVKRWIGRTRRD